MADETIAAKAEMPHFGGGHISLRKVTRQPAESITSNITGAKADRPRNATGNVSRSKSIPQTRNRLSAYEIAHYISCIL